MNEAQKARIANIFTAVVTIITVIQGTFLTTPPFGERAVFVVGAIFTYLAMGLTAWKQYLSPDVNSTGTKVTLGVAVIATVAGLSDLIGIFKIPEITSQYIKWGISVLVTVLNILSKQLFPSVGEKAKMAQLKRISLVLLFFVLSGSLIQAQSLVKKIYIKPPAAYSKALRSFALPSAVVVSPPDTTFGALRPFTGIAYSFPNNQAQGIAGIGWQNITYTYATDSKPEEKYVNWSLNGIFTLGATTTGQIRETSAFSFGGLVGVRNNSLMVGAVWNKGKKHPDDPTEKEKYLPQVIVCYGINLN